MEREGQKGLSLPVSLHLHGTFWVTMLWLGSHWVRHRIICGGGGGGVDATLFQVRIACPDYPYSVYPKSYTGPNPNLEKKPCDLHPVWGATPEYIYWRLNFWVEILKTAWAANIIHEQQLSKILLNMKARHMNISKYILYMASTKSQPPTWTPNEKASCSNPSANRLLLISNEGRDFLSCPGAMPL